MIAVLYAPRGVEMVYESARYNSDVRRHEQSYTGYVRHINTHIINNYYYKSLAVGNQFHDFKYLLTWCKSSLKFT